MHENILNLQLFTLGPNLAFVRWSNALNKLVTPTFWTHQLWNVQLAHVIDESYPHRSLASKLDFS